MTRLLPIALATIVAVLPTVAGCEEAEPPVPPKQKVFGTGKAETIDSEDKDWTQWRGPNNDGIALAGQSPPTSWGAGENIIWKADVPGRGHGSPILVGHRIFLATADRAADTQSLLCYDRTSGKKLWEHVVHEGGLTTDGNDKSSLASSTPTCDGAYVFINFLNSGAVYTTAVDIEGQRIWQTKISDYQVHQGYGSSPHCYGSLVIVSADNKGGGAFTALDRRTGDVVWSHDRPEKPNYVSPIVLKTGGEDRLYLYGCDLVSCFDPLSGEKHWEIEGATTESVTTTVTDGERIFTSGGYPDNHVSAVNVDGSGEAWRNNTRVYVPSMIVDDGYLYATADRGIAYCWRSDTGEEVWKERLDGNYTSSPVRVGTTMYATNEDGLTTIFKATPEEFKLIGTNQLGSLVYSTPVIVDSRIFMRVAENADGGLEEALYCIGEK